MTKTAASKPAAAPKTAPVSFAAPKGKGKFIVRSHAIFLDYLYANFIIYIFGVLSFLVFTSSGRMIGYNLDGSAPKRMTKAEREAARADAKKQADADLAARKEAAKEAEAAKKAKLAELKAARVAKADSAPAQSAEEKKAAAAEVAAKRAAEAEAKKAAQGT